MANRDPQSKATSILVNRCHFASCFIPMHYTRLRECRLFLLALSSGGHHLASLCRSSKLTFLAPSTHVTLFLPQRHLTRTEQQMTFDTFQEYCFPNFHQHTNIGSRAHNFNSNPFYVAQWLISTTRELDMSILCFAQRANSKWTIHPT